MNKIKYLIVLFVFFAPLLTRAQTVALTSFTLDNGMEVLVGENHKAPIAKMMLFYKVGAADEAVGKSGLAHLLEHLMFRGTTNVSADKFNDIMLKNGVDFNAYTSHDLTVYHALSDVSRLEVVLALEADRMQNLHIDDEAFESERKIVYQERQQRVENKSQTRFSEEVNKIFWLNTPYEHPISGTLAEIKGLTKQDALDFYQHYYTPSNVLLVITGDVTADEIKPIVQKYFGGIQKGAVPSRDFYFKASDSGTYYTSKKMKNIENARVSVSYMVPSAHENKKLAYALYVFSNSFGENGVHYLKKHLVKTQKVVAAGSNLSILGRGSGEFEISVLPNKDDKIENVVALIDNTLRAAVTGFTPELLEKEKKKILSWFVYIEDNPSDLAYLIGQLRAIGWSVDEIKNYASNIENVTIEDVREALSQMLVSKKMIAVLLPLPQKGEEND